MIDKLDVCIPAGRLRGRVAEILSDERHNVRPSAHYAGVMDLRPYGYEGVLHVNCKHGNKGDARALRSVEEQEQKLGPEPWRKAEDLSAAEWAAIMRGGESHGAHKLELHDTGAMSYRAMLHAISEVADLNPTDTRVLRVDVAADVPGVPVTWFHTHARVQFKQFLSKCGKLELVEMGKKRIQTLYFGKRPACIRVYDKVAEWEIQYDRERRAWDREEYNGCSDFPSFAEKYGVENSAVLTRVERQIGGRIPPAVCSAGRLRHAEDFRPFERVKLIHAGRVVPREKAWSPLRYLAGLQIRSMCERGEQGMQELYAILNRTGNGKKYLKEFAEFMPSGESGITEGRLQELYRTSISRQLAA